MTSTLEVLVQTAMLISKGKPSAVRVVALQRYNGLWLVKAEISKLEDKYQWYRSPEGNEEPTVKLEMNVVTVNLIETEPPKDNLVDTYFTQAALYPHDARVTMTYQKLALNNNQTPGAFVASTAADIPLHLQEVWMTRGGMLAKLNISKTTYQGDYQPLIWYPVAQHGTTRGYVQYYTLTTFGNLRANRSVILYKPSAKRTHAENLLFACWSMLAVDELPSVI